MAELKRILLDLFGRDVAGIIGECIRYTVDEYIADNIDALGRLCLDIPIADRKLATSKYECKRNRRTGLFYITKDTYRNVHYVIKRWGYDKHVITAFKRIFCVFDMSNERFHRLASLKCIPDTENYGDIKDYPEWTAALNGNIPSMSNERLPACWCTYDDNKMIHAVEQCVLEWGGSVSHAYRGYS